MPRFYINSCDLYYIEEDTFVLIKGNDAVHISKVLRMKVGDSITLCDERGFEYSSFISNIGTDVTLKIVEKQLTENESPYYSIVFQSLVKGDRFDTVIQKSTELGVNEIVPIITSRCVVKLEEKEYEKKVSRWQRIAYEASKQCGRGNVPLIRKPVSFSQALKDASECDISLFCYEGESTESIRNILSEKTIPRTVAVIIGPEGGFSFEEAELAKKAGLNMTGLGKRILRTETAAPFALACLSFQFEL